MGMMMVMMMGIVACCSAGASSIVALVNEKIIELDVLNFLLIPGWGKDKTASPPGAASPPGSTVPVASSEHCKDTAKTECTGITGSARDTCTSKSKAACIARGGTWTSSIETYPTDCIAGSKEACSGKTGSARSACTGDYKKRCVAAGGTWGTSSTPTTAYPPGPPPAAEWKEGCYYKCKSPVDPKYDTQYSLKKSDNKKCVRIASSGIGAGKGGHVAAGPYEINAVLQCP